MPKKIPNLNDFSEADILAWLGAPSLAKGRPYVDLVSDFQMDTSGISGYVQGSARRPYHALALISPEGGLLAQCSCPVGYGCKHIAALLLKAIAERNPVERVSSSVLSWVEDLRRASIAVAKKKARPVSARQQLFYLLKTNANASHFGIVLVKGKYAESADEW